MKYKVLGILLCVGLLFSSCNDFLEPKIYSDFTDENFPKSDKDVDLVLASFYANFSSTWGPQDPAVNPTSEDRKMWATYCGMNGWSQVSSAVSDEMFDQWYPAWRFGAMWSFTNNKTFFQGCYQRVAVVAKATQFISLFQSQLDALKAKTSKTNVDYVSIAKRELAIAEIRALRGWTMFLLYDWFGAVEVKYDVNTLDDMGFATRPAHQSNSEYTQSFLNKMVSDLKYGANHLLDAEITTTNKIVNVTVNGATVGQIDKLGSWGRLNKDVARMLLMKHYMNRAAETSNVALWDSAKLYCDTVRTNSIYSLNPVYSKVFTDITITGPSNNKEVIWATTFGPRAESQSYQANTPKGCIEILGLSRNGLGWGGYYMPWDFYYSFDTTGIVNTGVAQDERLKTIADWYSSSDSTLGYIDPISKKTVKKAKRYVRYHNYTTHGRMIDKAIGRYDTTKYIYEQPGSLELYGAVVVKWLISENDASRGQHSSVPFRYADVLLSAAEIELNRVGGSQSVAQGYIQMITDRANTTKSVSREIEVTSGQANGKTIRVIGAKSALAAGCPKDTLMEFLFQERGRELYWEGWRRMDMIRFQSTKGATNKFIEFASRFNVPLSDKHYLKFPIPQKALYESGGAYIQNLGH